MKPTHQPTTAELLIEMDVTKDIRQHIRCVHELYLRGYIIVNTPKYEAFKFSDISKGRGAAAGMRDTTVYQLLRTGRIRAALINGRWRVTQQAVDEFLGQAQPIKAAKPRPRRKALKFIK